MADLSKVGERDRLKVRREPHWQRIRPGCFLGYRPSARGGAGTWIARAYDEDEGKYRLKSLGSFGGLQARERFAAAKLEAEAHAETVEAGGEREDDVETVADACRAYEKRNAEAKGRFKRYVYSDPLAKLRLDRLRRKHLRDWRERLEETPALVSRSKAAEAKTRNRAPSSINRDMAALRAALRLFLAPGTPGTNAAWQEALKPIRNADRRRTLALSQAERVELLKHVPAEGLPFVNALCWLPLRPGAMAKLTVGDWDKRTSELTIDHDKNGEPRRILLPTEIAKLLNAEAKDKLPGAPLFMRANGQPWNKENWNGPIRAAAKSAGLPEAVTAYTIRHSVISDLVNGGLPILTVAQISGTSVEMIERHYGHLARQGAADALARLAQ